MDAKRDRRETGAEIARQPAKSRRWTQRADGALGDHDAAGASEAVRSAFGQLAARVDELMGERAHMPADAHEDTSRLADLSADVRGIIAHLSTRVEALTGELEQARLRILELESLADEDTLLPVLNRRGFMRELARTIAFIGRYRTAAALIHADVDGLKHINDNLGHAAGNAVLKAVAARLRGNVRASDIIGRLGGDEFALVLWSLSPEEAERKAVALAWAVAREPVVVDGLAIDVTISAGVTALSGEDSAENALKRADEIMYRAKRRRG